MEPIKAKRLGRESTDGVYYFDFSSGYWVMMEESASPLVPKERYSLVYFDNTLCPVCRRYDLHWYPFVESNLDRLRGFGLYVVLCDWFTQQCTSARGAMTFIEYNVRASPTTMLMLSDGSKVIYTERYEGLLTERDLNNIVFTFPERAERAARGERVERPLTEEEMIEQLSKTLAQGGAGTKP
ncbi:hypothetical protein [Acidilobus sp.]|jgi:hypothetical protein|uniref:hypothetical protein n=1 Tax=Acidilobus sp. TaxID=1872109 RepID=UPI003CFCC36A